MKSEDYGKEKSQISDHLDEGAVYIQGKMRFLIHQTYFFEKHLLLYSREFFIRILLDYLVENLESFWVLPTMPKNANFCVTSLSRNF